MRRCPRFPSRALPALLALGWLLCALPSRAALDFLPPISAPAANPAQPMWSPPFAHAPLATAATAGDGTWREIGMLPVYDHAAYVDPVADRLVVLGGSRWGAWTLPLSGPSDWQPQWFSEARPCPFRFGWASDPATGLIYFTVGAGDGPQVWTLDPASGATTRILATGTPPDVFYASMTYDPVGRRVVLFGGMSVWGTPLNDVWALDLRSRPTWEHWAPAGVAPPACTLADMFYDSRRHCVVVVGTSPAPPTGVWALSLDGAPAWTRLAAESPQVELDLPSFVYDGPGDRVLTLGIDGAVHAYALDTNTWSLLSPVNAGPAPRGAPGLAIDAARHRLLVSGGVKLTEWSPLDDTWALALEGSPTWSVLVPPTNRISARGGAAFGHDAARNRLVVFAGFGSSGAPTHDTWVMALNDEPTWSALATDGPTPPSRSWSSEAWDSSHDRLVVLGGYDGGLHPLGDLWALSFGSATPTWTAIEPAGPTPSPRFSGAMVFDSARDRFLLFGGTTNTAVLADLWELRLGPVPAWRQMAPAGTAPAARGAQMAVYDPLGDRMILFGGGAPTGLLSETWQLDLGEGDGTWTPLPSAGGPSARADGVFVLDAPHERVLMFGGYGVDTRVPPPVLITYLSDAWSLSLAGTPAWSPLPTAGERPQGRDRACGAYDAANDRLVVTCGGINGMNDAWTLDFGGSPTATALALASQDVAFDRVRLEWEGATPGANVTVYRRETGADWARFTALVADGEGRVTLEDRGVAPGATYAYRLGIASAAGEAFYGETSVRVPAAALRLAAASDAGHATLSFTLGSGRPAALELYDVSGRRIWQREVGSLGAGSHAVSVDEPLRPALYFARLVQAGEARRARLVVTR